MFFWNNIQKTNRGSGAEKTDGANKETLENTKVQEERAGSYVPADLVTPLYTGMTNNLLLGTPEEARYVDRLLKDIKQANAEKGNTYLLDAYDTVLVRISKKCFIVKRGSADCRMRAGGSLRTGL